MSDTTNIQSLGSGKSGFKTWQAVIEKFRELGVSEEAIQIVVDRTSARPELLETFDNQHPENLYLVPFVQPNIEFTSLCPKTGQPDFAAMEIVYVPNVKMVESKSLKLYLTSFREDGSFHEDVCNDITNTLFTLLEPKYLRVYGDFVSRGSLAIKPLIEKWQENLDSLIVNQIRWLVKSYDSKKRK